MAYKSCVKQYSSHLRRYEGNKSRKQQGNWHSIYSNLYKMSAPTSPRPSFESEDRPDASQSMPQTSDISHSRNNSLDGKPRTYSPRRRSIQFNVGPAEAQLPTRSLSFKDKEKRLSFGEPLNRDLESDREQRTLQTSRGPSPPPPKYVNP